MTAHQRGVHPKTVPPCHQGLQLLLHRGSEKGPSSGLSVLRTHGYSSSGGMGPCRSGIPGRCYAAMLSRDVRFLHDFLGVHSFWIKTVTSTKTLMYKLSGNVWWKGSDPSKNQTVNAWPLEKDYRMVRYHVSNLRYEPCVHEWGGKSMPSQKWCFCSSLVPNLWKIRGRIPILWIKFGWTVVNPSAFVGKK